MKRNRLFFCFLLSTLLTSCNISEHLSGLNNNSNQNPGTTNSSTGGAIVVGPKGSESNPYLISSVTDFNNISKYLNKEKIYFKQTADIDFKDVSFSPIGNYEAEFKGNYDGNGYVIKNITCSQTLTDWPARDECEGYALFGNASNATFKNISLENIDITSGYTIGGIAGITTNCTFTGCNVKGDIKTTGKNAGLIVGRGLNTTIKDCHVNGDIEVIRKGGGIIGYNQENFVIENCSADINIKIESTYNQVGYCGGIAGYLDCNDTSLNPYVTNCYATGSIVLDSKKTGNGFLGGLIGYCSVIDVNNCYATTNITSNGLYDTYKDKTTCEGGLWWQWRNPCGALIGVVNFNYRFNLSNCYATGTIVNDRVCKQEEDFGLYCDTSLIGLCIDNRTLNAIEGDIAKPGKNYYYEIDAEKYYVDITKEMVKDMINYTFTNNYCLSDKRTTFSSMNYFVINSYINKVVGIYKSMPTYTICTNITDEELKVQNTFENYDFENVWEFTNNHPTLRNNPEK